MIDTGSAVSLLDAQLADALSASDDEFAAFERRLVGIGGRTKAVPFSYVRLSVIGGLSAVNGVVTIERFPVGFVGGLAMSVGNLLGRDFLEHVDFGLHHRRPNRELYLGRV